MVRIWGIDGEGTTNSNTKNAPRVTYLTICGQHNRVVGPALDDRRLPAARQSRRRVRHLLDGHAELEGAVRAPRVQYSTLRLVCTEFGRKHRSKSVFI